jgi:hypothetical protein
VLSKLRNPANDHDGFLARVLLTYPDPVPRRFTKAGIDPDAEEAVEKVFQRLFIIGDQTTPSTVGLEPAALDLFIAWHDAHAGESEAPDFDPLLAGPWSKMYGQCARIALILHCIEGTRQSALAVETMEKAIQLTEYFKAHARRVYFALSQHLASSKQERHSLEQRVLAFLREHKAATVTAIHRSLGNNVLAEDLRRTLDSLAALELIRQGEGVIDGPGRRPTVWEYVDHD